MVQYVIRTNPQTGESELVLVQRPLGSLARAGVVAEPLRPVILDRTSTADGAAETLLSHKSLAIKALATAAAEERRVVRSIHVVDEVGSIYKNDVAMRKCLKIMLAIFESGDVDVLLVVEASRLMRVHADLPQIIEFIQAADAAGVPVFTLLPASYFNANSTMIDGERCVPLREFNVSEATSEGHAFYSAVQQLARRLADSLVINGGVVSSRVISLVHGVTKALLSVTSSRIDFVAVCARTSPPGDVGRALNAGLSQVTCTANLFFGAHTQQKLLLRLFAGDEGISVCNDFNAFPLVQLLNQVGATASRRLHVFYRSLERIARSEELIRRLCVEERARIVVALMPRTLFAALVKLFTTDHDLVAAIILPTLPVDAPQRATLIAYVGALRRIVDNGGIYGLNPCLVLPFQLNGLIVEPLCLHERDVGCFSARLSSRRGIARHAWLTIARADARHRACGTGS